MGEVIRKSAATLDIFADARSTLTAAQGHGGETQTLADAALGPTLHMGEDISQKLGAARAAVAPLDAAVDVENERADNLLGRISDEIWNLLGRPAFDPALDILFPGGIAYYAEGDVTAQPERMDLLAGLLRSGVHPRIPLDRAQALAGEIEASAASLRAKVDAARPVRLRVEHLSRMHTAVARSVQIQLVNLKRLYKAHGLSEADIHRIIPDRPRPVAKPVQPGSA